MSPPDANDPSEEQPNVLKLVITSDDGVSELDVPLTAETTVERVMEALRAAGISPAGIFRRSPEGEDSPFVWERFDP